MKMPPGLAADLAKLTEALSEPGFDLGGLVAGCHDALLSVVPSAVGLSVTTGVGGVEVTISTVPHIAVVGSSLRVALAAGPDAVNPPATVVFAASAAGALTEMAATLLGSCGFTGDAAVLDAELTPGRAGTTALGLGEVSVVHQALGVLLDRGRTPQTARAELDHAAELANLPLPTVAEQLLRALASSDGTSTDRVASSNAGRRLRLVDSDPRRGWFPSPAGGFSTIAARPTADIVERPVRSTGRQQVTIGRGSRGADRSRPWAAAPPSAAGWAGRVHTGYRHECLLYDGDDDFLAAVLPFIYDGLDRRQPVLVAVTGTRLDGVRSALGADQELVMFADMADLGGNPARIIPVWREFTDRYGAHRQPVRGIGEPIWAGRSDPEIAECQLHEALLNMAVLPDTPLWLICPYDIRTLDRAVITEAHRSHPHLARTDTVRGLAGAAGDGVREIGSGYGGTAHVDDLFEAALPEPASAPTSMEFTPDRRAEVTNRMMGYAAAAGVPAEETAKLATAVGDIAAAAYRETLGPVRVRLWRDKAAVVCDVHDPAIIDEPMIGRGAIAGPGSRERELRLANQLCDLVQVRSNTTGTTVRVHHWLP